MDLIQNTTGLLQQARRYFYRHHGSLLSLRETAFNIKRYMCNSTGLKNIIKGNIINLDFT